jgi:hypothetical protein
LIGIVHVIAAIVGCTSEPDRTQQLLAAENALGSIYEHFGPTMINHLDDVGTNEPRLAE